jgi:hypothetical protein
VMTSLGIVLGIENSQHERQVGWWTMTPPWKKGTTIHRRSSSRPRPRPERAHHGVERYPKPRAFKTAKWPATDFMPTHPSADWVSLTRTSNRAARFSLAPARGVV